MAHKSLVPKQRALTDHESQTSFDSWIENMIFHISLSDKSTRFLPTGDLKTWSTTEDRGFIDDTGDEAHVTPESKMNKRAKAALLNVILGSIAGYTPVISSRFVKHQSTSLESIWNRLRGYYGFRRTGSRILDLMEIKMELNESRESLWEKLYSFLEDQMLTKDGTVMHNYIKQEANEEFTPTLLNMLVTTWLHIISPTLPPLVKQRFATQLRSCTLFTIRDEISDAIPSLLSELEDKECSINRAGNFQKYRSSKGKNWSNSGPSKSWNSSSPNKNWGGSGPKRSCCLCETAGRQSTDHFLSTCPFLPADDRKYMTKAREICIPEEEDEEYQEYDSATRNVAFLTKEDENSVNVFHQQCAIQKVDVDASPILAVSVKGVTSYWTLDSGAEASIMEEIECNRLGLEILPTIHRATQGDGKTPLITVGEVHFIATRGHHKLYFSGLVVKDSDSPVLAGAAFHRINMLTIDYGYNNIIIDDCCKIKYDPKKRVKKTCVRALRVAKQTCILPGESISFQLPEELCTKDSVAIEPRITVPRDMPDWIKCAILTPDAEGSISVKNTCSSPVLLSKHTQVCQVRPTIESKDVNAMDSITSTPNTTQKADVPTQKVHACIEMNLTSKPQKTIFDDIHKEYNSVFSPGIGCYNGYAGEFSHVINMSKNLPPQRKGRVPDYSKGNKDILQEKFDQLLKEGVLSRAEDVNQPVEYVHPSFLIKKASGGHRLVTSFGEMADYAKPQPTTNTNVEHAIHQIGQYEEVIITDLKDSYYQIPLNAESSKFVGIITPYTGTYVYRRSVMGLPGSEAALEELLSRIFGDLIKEGKMVKVADDLFLGAQNVEDLANIWKEVLRRLQLNGLKLSSTKTKICPTSATILGWEWKKGSIQPGQHRINALAACKPPTTVKGLRSYIGCYKFNSRVIQHYAEKLHPLEEECAGKQSAEKIVWTEELLNTFSKSQVHLQKAKSVTIPKTSEQLHIVTDASSTGLAATLFVVRNNKLTLAGYFSAALKANQPRLLPCELEALAIAVSLKHFSYFITQSTVKTRILTDSRPCVLAYKKLQRGQFSASPKVTTFISAVHRYPVEMLHISGSSNLFSDFASRNPVKCTSSNCAICTFVDEMRNCTVGEVSVSDVMSGKAKVPFATKSSWLQTQRSCPDLTRVYNYLTAGASVSKKNKKLTDVKRYLSCGVTVLNGQHEGLLVIKHSTPFKPVTTRIVIPREVSDGLLTAIHISMNHPSANQLKLIFSREFFCLDLALLAKKVTDQCYTCAALKNLPSTYHKQSTSVPGGVIGCKFSADVARRFSQFILLAREDITSYTVGTLISNEKADTLRDGLLLLMSNLRSQHGPPAIIRTDPATSLRSLINDKTLEKFNLQIVLGDEKNINKNPIAESAIGELHSQLKRLQPSGGRITETTLAQAISSMNSLIRYHKHSATEAWTKRDMSTGQPLDLKDTELIEHKYTQRCNSHEASARHKSRGKTESTFQAIATGQLVFLYSDASKLKSRDRYMVTAVKEDYVWVQKFTKDQFRKRVYRVKRSDLIIIPKELPAQQNTCNEALPEPAVHRDKRDQTSYEAQKKYRPNKRLDPCKSQMLQFYDPSHFVSESSDEDSEDDDYGPDNLLSYFLPNSSQAAESSTSEEEVDNGENADMSVPHTTEDEQVNEVLSEEDLQEQAVPTEGRPIRNKKEPAYLQDFITDVSALFLEDTDDKAAASPARMLTRSQKPAEQLDQQQ